MKKYFFLQAHIKCCWILTSHWWRFVAEQRIEFVDFVQTKFWTILGLMFYMLPWEWSRTEYSKAFISFFYSSELWSLDSNWKLSEHGRHITIFICKLSATWRLYMKISEQGTSHLLHTETNLHTMTMQMVDICLLYFYPQATYQHFASS